MTSMDNKVSSEALKNDDLEERFKIMLELSPASICLVEGSELRIKWANQAFRRILDASFNSIPIAGKKLSEVFTNFIGSETEAIFTSVAQTSKPFYTREYKFNGISRGETYWEWSLTPIPQPSGFPDLMVQGVEVTDLVASRKMVEQQAKEILRHRRIHDAILDTTPDYYYVTDTEGTITYANVALADFLGFTREHMIGKTYLQLGFPYDVATEVNGRIKLAVKTRKKQKFESHFVSPTGEAAYLEKIYVPILDEHGDVEAVAGIVHNLTARKHSEEQIKQSELRFKFFVDHLPQMAWMAGPDGNVYWYNQRWYDYTGTTLEEMAGWGWKRVHHPDHLSSVMEEWQKSLAAGKTFTMEFPIRGKDGEYHIFSTTAVPFKDKDGAIIVWFGINARV